MDRLDRIEQKLDRVVDALADLARIDERQDALAQRIDRHEFRLDLIEDAQQQNSETLRRARERGCW